MSFVTPKMFYAMYPNFWASGIYIWVSGLGTRKKLGEKYMEEKNQFPLQVVNLVEPSFHPSSNPNQSILC